MAKVHVKATRYEITQSDKDEVYRHVERLERRLAGIEPDLANVNIEIEWHARLRIYDGSVRLTIFNRALPARLNNGPTVEAFLNSAFQDVEEQLERFKSNLRREYAYERKRTSLSPEAAQYQERQLIDERLLLDRSLAGDRAAFTDLTNFELPRVASSIEEALETAGFVPDQELVQQVLTDTIEIAFRDLRRKPVRWSMRGWLISVARKAVNELSSHRPIAQSYEQPAA